MARLPSGVLARRAGLGGLLGGLLAAVAAAAPAGRVLVMRADAPSRPSLLVRVRRRGRGRGRVRARVRVVARVN